VGSQAPCVAGDRSKRTRERARSCCLLCIFPKKKQNFISPRNFIAMIFVLLRHKMYRWIYEQHSVGIREAISLRSGPDRIRISRRSGEGGMAGAAQLQATINFSYHTASFQLRVQKMSQFVSHSVSRICKCLRSPGIDSEEAIPPAYVAWRAGTTNRVIVPARQARNRFLGSLKGLQIRALVYYCRTKMDFSTLKKSRNLTRMLFTTFM
jgi:hypothetical protein